MADHRCSLIFYICIAVREYAETWRNQKCDAVKEIGRTVNIGRRLLTLGNKNWEAEPYIGWVPMPIHTHWFWVGMGAMLLFMGGHQFCASVHPAPNRSQTFGCREYANQEALRAEAINIEQLFICPIQPRLGVGG